MCNQNCPPVELLLKSDWQRLIQDSVMCVHECMYCFCNVSAECGLYMSVSNGLCVYTWGGGGGGGSWVMIWIITW